MATGSDVLCILNAGVMGGQLLREKLGAAEANRAVERCLNRIERASVANGGKLLKTKDGEMSFSFDHLDKTIRAACDIQQKVDDLPPVSGIKLTVRGSLVCRPATLPTSDAEAAAARLFSLSRAGQVMIDGATVKKFPPLLLARIRPIESGRSDGEPSSDNYWELLWRTGVSSTASPQSAPTMPAVSPGRRLRLCYGEREIFVDARHPAVTLGRDKHCDLVIRDTRASREHARIELHEGKFVLTDQSTNGTHLVSEDDGTQVIANGALELRGHGQIRFGKPASQGVPDIVDYSVVS